MTDWLPVLLNNWLTQSWHVTGRVHNDLVINEVLCYSGWHESFPRSSRMPENVGLPLEVCSLKALCDVRARLPKPVLSPRNCLRLRVTGRWRDGVTVRRGRKKKERRGLGEHLQGHLLAVLFACQQVILWFCKMRKKREWEKQKGGGREGWPRFM